MEVYSFKNISLDLSYFTVISTQVKSTVSIPNKVSKYSLHRKQVSTFIYIVFDTEITLN